MGIEDADAKDDIEWLSKKIANLRIFNDANRVMNTSVLDIAGDAIVVSQSTLHVSKKRNRPSYLRALKPDVAIPLYESFVWQLEIDLGKRVQTGEFGADMKVKLLNDGPSYYSHWYKRSKIKQNTSHEMYILRIFAMENKLQTLR